MVLHLATALVLTLLTHAVAAFVCLATPHGAPSRPVPFTDLPQPKVRLSKDPSLLVYFTGAKPFRMGVLSKDTEELSRSCPRCSLLILPEESAVEWARYSLRAYPPWHSSFDRMTWYARFREVQGLRRQTRIAERLYRSRNSIAEVVLRCAAREGRLNALPDASLKDFIESQYRSGTGSPVIDWPRVRVFIPTDPEQDWQLSDVRSFEFTDSELWLDLKGTEDRVGGYINRKDGVAFIWFQQAEGWVRKLPPPEDASIWCQLWPWLLSFFSVWLVLTAPLAYSHEVRAAREAAGPETRAPKPETRA